MSQAGLSEIRKIKMTARSAGNGYGLKPSPNEIIENNLGSPPDDHRAKRGNHF
jgi:hypothetical protein